MVGHALAFGKRRGVSVRGNTRGFRSVEHGQTALPFVGESRAPSKLGRGQLVDPRLNSIERSAFGILNFIGSVASFGMEQEFAEKTRSPETQAATSKSSLMNRF